MIIENKERCMEATISFLKIALLTDLLTVKVL